MKILNATASHLKVNKTMPNAYGEKLEFFKFVMVFSLLIKRKIFDEIRPLAVAPSGK